MESGFRSFSDLGMDDLVFFEESELRSEINDLHHENYLKRAVAAEALISEFMPPFKTLTWNSRKPMMNPNDEEARYSYSTAPLNLMFSYDQHQLNHRPSQIDKISTTINREHCLAGRKGREKLAQGFVTLSTLIPCLKKGDRISILGDAINYIKQLQEKVKALEEQTNKTAMEVFKLKKYGDDDSSSDHEITDSFPEIEARFCNKEVLISIHCRKRKGILGKVVAEIDKFHLSVVNSTVMTYGDSAFNVTLIAEGKDGRTMNIKELVKNLCGVLR